MKIAYKTGKYDILRAKSLQQLDKEIQLSKKDEECVFALGIYDENLCEILGMDIPIKSTEDRMKIMEQIRGVDFTFPVSSKDPKIIEARLKEAYEKYVEKKKKLENELTTKKYKVGYAPGTYDLFHLGHLENIMEAARQSEFLIVGVKDDELVKSHKNKEPIMCAEERMEILRHFKMVSGVYRYYVRDLHVANDWIRSRYGNGADAIFLGSDLEKDFSHIKDINIIFTERPPELMKTRSSTALRTLYLGNRKNKEYRGEDVRKRDIVKEEKNKGKEIAED